MKDNPARSPGMARKRGLLVVSGAALAMLTLFTLAGILMFDRYRPPSSAMVPTVQPGDRIWTRPAGGVERGDVVLLIPPRTPEGGSVTPFSQRSLIVTRIVAIGGDTVSGSAGALYLNEEKVDEPYLGEDGTTRDFDSVRVPEGHAFFLGDNRQNSVGSPYLGPVPLADIKQQVSWIGAPSMGPIVTANAVLMFAFIWFAFPGIGEALRERRDRA